ncbi:hypothetical protein [Pseudactinotalea sp. HY158]|uniref:hypothetical protein n=1 Tax=Pseudactinotalea sp. HY158 TaxID=2654547 RepID=UPI00129D14B3|nr:hypothetical protein [Pseudactinotalea sp. HY158]QGH70685.1 hypothetical protein GCE65_15185 [Pseudactinotalea sp. HY158]
MTATEQMAVVAREPVAGGGAAGDRLDLDQGEIAGIDVGQGETSGVRVDQGETAGSWCDSTGFTLLGGAAVAAAAARDALGRRRSRWQSGDRFE